MTTPDETTPDLLELFAELLAETGMPEQRKAWVLELLTYALRGDAIEGLDLTTVSPWVAYSLGGFTAELAKRAERRGHELGLAEGYEQAMRGVEAADEALGWASLPENVRMLITDASLIIERAVTGERVAGSVAVWKQHMAAVVQGRFGRYALKTDGSGVDTSDGQPKSYLLWDNERGMWWKPNAYGYTHSVVEAGVYTRDEAVKWALQGAFGGLSHATVIVADGAA